ncbi:MAG: helix-turn-helix transcriptional regulator [Chthonomonas sp.]|nr:helix-turn-helix transcriptional regulator [Chthonomonas sp.]
MKSVELRIGTGLTLHSERHNGDGELALMAGPAEGPIGTFRYEGERKKPLDVTFHTAEDRCHFAVVHQGHVLIPHKRLLLAPGSVIKVAGDTQFRVTFSRGPIQLSLLALDPELTSQLNCSRHEIKSASIYFDPTNMLDEVILAELLEPAISPYRSFGWALALVNSPQRVASIALSRIRVPLPAPLQRLTDSVRAEPNQAWSLKEASKLVSYSPFHLSRTFRQLAGYGFPDFVDRCRTEMALKKILADQDEQIDQVALSSGFGSTQAMRDSFRDYIGFLPSEVRVG